MPLAEYDPLDPQVSLYVRAIRSVTQRDGSTIHAWAYVYNWNRSGLSLWRAAIGAPKLQRLVGGSRAGDEARTSAPSQVQETPLDED